MRSGDFFHSPRGNQWCVAFVLNARDVKGLSDRDIRLRRSSHQGRVWPRHHPHLASGEHAWLDQRIGLRQG